MGVSRSATRSLRSLRKKIQSASQTLAPTLLEAVAGAVEETIKREFDSGVDPDGVPWPAPKNGGKPLVRTGRLRDSFRMRRSSRNAFRLESDATEQRSAVRHPRKSSTVLPRGSRKYAIVLQGKYGIVWRRRHAGKLWRKAINAAIRRAIKRVEADLKKP